MIFHHNFAPSASFPQKVPGNLREREFKVRFRRHQGLPAWSLHKNTLGVASRDSLGWSPQTESLEWEREVHQMVSPHPSIPSCLCTQTSVKLSPYLLWPVSSAITSYEIKSNMLILTLRKTGGSQRASLLQNLHWNSHLIPTFQLSLAAAINFEDSDSENQEAFCPGFMWTTKLNKHSAGRKESFRSQYFQHLPFP